MESHLLCVPVNFRHKLLQEVSGSNSSGKSSVGWQDTASISCTISRGKGEWCFKWLLIFPLPSVTLWTAALPHSLQLLVSGEEFACSSRHRKLLSCLQKLRNLAASPSCEIVLPLLWEITSSLNLPCLLPQLWQQGTQTSHWELYKWKEWQWGLGVFFDVLKHCLFTGDMFSVY